MARQFKVGDRVKFGSCGPTLGTKTCHTCDDCVAEAYNLIDESEKKGGSCHYVHGLVTHVSKKVHHRGKVCTVQVRKKPPLTIGLDDASHSVEIPMWLLRPSKKTQFFSTTTIKSRKKREEKACERIINVLSFI